MEERAPGAEEKEMAAARQAMIYKYPYRIDGDAEKGYTVVNSDTEEAVAGPTDHTSAARECGRRNMDFANQVKARGRELLADVEGAGEGGIHTVDQIHEACEQARGELRGVQA